MAVPAYSTPALPSFQFSNSGISGGSVTVNNNTHISSETLGGLSGIEFNRVVISNAPDAADDGTWTLTGTGGFATLAWAPGGDLVLTGAFTSCSGCVGTIGTGANQINLGTGGGSAISGILETSAPIGFTYGATPGFTTTTGNVTQIATITFGTATSISEIPILLTDLGLSGAYSSALDSGNGGGITTSNCGSACNTTGSNTFTASSETLNVAFVATPEPVSFFLLGSGLLGIGIVARKKSTRA